MAMAGTRGGDVRRERAAERYMANQLRAVAGWARDHGIAFRWSADGTTLRASVQPGPRTDALGPLVRLLAECDQLRAENDLLRGILVEAARRAGPQSADAPNAESPRCQCDAGG